jgi:hypothetical protein
MGSCPDMPHCDHRRCKKPDQQSPLLLRSGRLWAAPCSTALYMLLDSNVPAPNLATTPTSSSCATTSNGERAPEQSKLSELIPGDVPDEGRPGAGSDILSVLSKDSQRNQEKVRGLHFPT